MDGYTRWEKPPVSVSLPTWEPVGCAPLPMRLRHLLLPLLLLLTAWPLAVPARAHLADLPSIWADAHVQDDGIRLRLTVKSAILAKWLGLEAVNEREFWPAEPSFPTDVADKRKIVQDFAALLSSKVKLTIDGKETLCDPREIEAPPDLNDDDGPGYWCITTFFATDSQPRRATFEWLDFADASFELLPEVSLNVHAGRRYLSTRRLVDYEPEYTWHTDEIAVAPPRLLRPVEPPPDPVLPLPVLAIGIAILALVLVPVLRRLDRHASITWGAPAVLLLVAGFVWANDVGVVAVDDPFVERVTVPSPVQAQEMFTQLHDNVYASFDAATEDEIYDLLAASVAPEMLDELYVDVYESLILREAGGAFAQVDEVERQLVEPTLPPPRLGRARVRGAHQVERALYRDASRTSPPAAEHLRGELHRAPRWARVEACRGRRDRAQTGGTAERDRTRFFGWGR